MDARDAESVSEYQTTAYGGKSLETLSSVPSDDIAS